MRISTYALTTNPKYANFFEWQALAGKALSTPVGAAKLGAGIGAGVGAINYLGSEDKSIGNLAGQVAGGAALGGAAGYAGSSLRNAWQARKAGNQAILQGGNPNAPQLAPAAATQAQYPAQPKSYANGSSGKPIVTPIKEQAQSPATSGAIVPVTSQSGNSAPQNPVNTKISGAAESERQKMKGVDNSGRSNQSVPIEKASGDVRGAQSSAQIKNRAKAQAAMLKSYGVTNWQDLPDAAKQMYISFGKDAFPFANFKVRRYNGFVY